MGKLFDVCGYFRMVVRCANKDERPIEMAGSQVEKQWPIELLLDMAAVADARVGYSRDIRGLWDGPRIRAEVDAVGRKRYVGIDFPFFFEQRGGMNKDLVNSSDQARFPFGDWNIDNRERIFVVNMIAT